MPTTPRIVTRFANRTEFLIRDPGADVSVYKFYGANTLNAAFVAPNFLFSVPRLNHYRSNSIVTKRWGLSGMNYSGLTRALVDFEDFWVAGGTLPHDVDQLYIRVSEVNGAGVERPAGPILVVPPPNFYDVPRPAMTVSGIAPDVAADPAGFPPTGSLHFAVPRFTDNIRIKNASISTLYIAFDAGQPEMSVPPNSTEVFYGSAISDVYAHGVGAEVEFEIRFAIANGVSP